MWSNYPEIQNELELVEEFLTRNIRSRNVVLSDIVKELVEAGGKRLRPAFVVLAAQMGKYDRKKVLPRAAALEILHTATLVLDDIVDQ